MKSKLTKAKEISEATKKAVLERQNNRSISGVYLIGKPVEYHHVIYRSQGGIGVEWNVVAITSEEHRALHDGQSIKVNGKEYYTCEEFKTLIKNHLKLFYACWSEDACKYHKGWELSAYGVKKRENKLSN